MKNYIIPIFLFFLISECYSQKSTNYSLIGMHYVKTHIENYENGEPISITYYINFDDQLATLNFSNNKYAVCEGIYYYKMKNKLLCLKRDENDGRACPNIEDANYDKSFPYGSEIIYIKKVKKKYYIKSKRFYHVDWQLLSKQ